MPGVISPFVSGYPQLPVISGSASLNSQLVASSANAASWQPGLVSLAATAPAGFPLQNATPTILSWTVPNDGQNHRVTLIASLDVTLAATGGGISITYTMPSGNAHTSTVLAASQTAGGHLAITGVTVQPNTTVTVTESTALTAGAATLWAELWGS